MVNKLKSRKLWTALLGIASGIAIAFGVDQETVGIVAGAAVSLGSTVAYIITEGRIDAAAVGNTAQQVQDAIDAVSGVEDGGV